MSTYGPIPHSSLAVGDRIAVRRHSGAEIVGTVQEIGEWHPSCAGSPMRWVTFRTADGAVRTVADTAHRDNEIRVLPRRAA